MMTSENYYWRDCSKEAPTKADFPLLIETDYPDNCVVPYAVWTDPDSLSDFLSRKNHRRWAPLQLPAEPPKPNPVFVVGQKVRCVNAENQSAGGAMVESGRIYTISGFFERVGVVSLEEVIGSFYTHRFQELKDEEGEKPRLSPGDIVECINDASGWLEKGSYYSVTATNRTGTAVELKGRFGWWLAEFFELTFNAPTRPAKRSATPFLPGHKVRFKGHAARTYTVTKVSWDPDVNTWMIGYDSGDGRVNGVVAAHLLELAPQGSFSLPPVQVGDWYLCVDNDNGIIWQLTVGRYYQVSSPPCFGSCIVVKNDRGEEVHYGRRHLKKVAPPADGEPIFFIF